ncbi:S-layer homology domain-containing protein [Flavonifractor plautii]|uniref:S-layer homology domain-containing protein n=1 Tax=Flavonifractor plautii TaxID=292800 RepID=UPI0019576B8B|nr:S-layer homology domain-containing protein [Flavonifractor plautii]MBM6665503.1 S-layer homology domain-containing protein [Flavonifractor plautii]
MRFNKQKLLSGVLATGLALSCMVGPAFAASNDLQVSPAQVAAVSQETLTFSDVPTTDWAYPYIMACVQKGAIVGTGEVVNGIGTFNPNGKVSLGQFLAVLTRLIAPDKIDTSLSGHWAMPNYSAAIDIGLIYSYEYSGSKTDLDKALTREEMAVLLSRAAEINGEPLEILPGIENNINDLDKVSIDKVTAVKQAYSSGLLFGVDNGNFDPKGTMTRAHMATVVCRLMNYAPRGEVTIKDPDTNVEESKSEYVVTATGETQGMLRSKYSREYELKALGAARTGEDANGVYVIFTAPQLPSEIANDFTINMSADVCKSNGDYFSDPIKVNLKSGETKKVYFKSYSGGKVTKSEIGSMSIGVYICPNSDNSKYMFTRGIESGYKTTANGKWYDGSADNVSFDSSAVWSGLGL